MTRDPKTIDKRDQDCWHETPSAARPIYRCTECGAQDHWGDGWLWYGDYIKGPRRILCPPCAAPHQHEVIRP